VPTTLILRLLRLARLGCSNAKRRLFIGRKRCECVLYSVLVTSPGIEPAQCFQRQALPTNYESHCLLTVYEIKYRIAKATTAPKPFRATSRTVQTEEKLQAAEHTLWRMR